MTLKYYLHIDSRESCSRIRKFFDTGENISVADTPETCDVIIVGGGDGWMLQAMRTFAETDKVLIGVNCGTLGFMLNARDETVWKGIAYTDLTILKLSKVIVNVKTTQGDEIQGFFYNDCVLGNHILDYTKYSRVCSKGKSHIATGTGLAVTTMLGSTGYALNLGQPIIPVDANLRGIVGIATAPFSYQYTTPQKLVVSCIGRQQIQCGLDGRAQLIDDVSTVTFTPSQESVSLGFLPGNNFATKRVLLAQEKMGGT